LPLDAESLVDPELADKGDESHDDGDSVCVLDHLVSNPSRCGLEGLTRGRQLQDLVSEFVDVNWPGNNVLKGQISVGMFLSWRMRWDTVWAVLYQYVLHYMLRSANWLTAVLLLLSID
jgi:hypothetical protein